MAAPHKSHWRGKDFLAKHPPYSSTEYLYLAKVLEKQKQKKPCFDTEDYKKFPGS